MILNIYIFFADRNFDYALGQFSPDGPGFPSIISAGNNNFCIHYYGYTGQAKDGDMILNDVGAQYDGLMFLVDGHATVIFQNVSAHCMSVHLPPTITCFQLFVQACACQMLMQQFVNTMQSV